MAAPNLALLFGALVAGGVVMDYGVKSIRTAHATAGTSTASTSTSSVPGSGGLLATLFPKGSRIIRGRKDQGLDITAPAGSPLLAPGNGYLLRNGTDPAGFGMSYPIVHFTSGPWAGLDIYFGHVRSMFAAGADFVAGEAIALTQNGAGPFVGNAAGMPGHVEIGLAPGGNPGPFDQPLPPGL